MTTLGIISILPFKEVNFTIPRKAKAFATTFSSIKESVLITNPAFRMIWMANHNAISSMTVPHSQIMEVQNHILIVIPIYHLNKLQMST
jgi:hypothetical protein